ncbi:MAG: hypothetical protein VBE63_09940 [Lamprobacter sp.]|uniref:hypothetical protein n=1 Tax=Lamprobacter sp. TaxID=3100796 RepID=UPI002B26282A|nr:hypothetical protein [Lamprobacter sp.]MEA3640251.1 hypothetical protein [Lamprobacter sp.]
MSRFNLSGAAKPTPVELVPDVDPDALRQFAEGAKDHRTSKEPPPWDAYPKDGKAKTNTTLRLNDRYFAMLRYIAEKEDISQHKVLMRLLIPMIEKRAKELYES